MSAYNEGLKAGTDKFVSLSIQAMKTLKRKGKPNVLKDFVKCLGLTRPALLEWKGSQIYQYLLSILRCKLTSQTTCLDSVFGVLDEDL
jgi:hypothetical protein